MADVITIGGVDRSAVVHWDSLKIEQVAGEYTAVCSLVLDDADATIDVDERSAIAIADGVETLFAGEVADVDWDLLSLGLDGRRVALRCQDYGILVEEAVIDALESYAATSDSDIIDDLFSTYRPDIDGTTHVSTIDASMDFSCENVTLRQALVDLCARTGGRWYVDEDKKLHYFAAEANVAAWHLSDTPDNVNSFPYHHIARKSAGGTVLNQFLVVGAGDVSEWREDAASVYIYGERPGVVIDTSIASAADAQARADALLARWAWPRVSYDVTTRKTGLRAGMDVRLVCGAWGVDETLTVRRLTIRWQGDERFYDLELGDLEFAALQQDRSYSSRLHGIEGAIVDLDTTVFDTDAPAAPTFVAGNLTTGVTEDADGHQVVWIKATWGLVADADLDHYEIQCADNNTFNWPMIFHVQAGDTREVIFQGLQGNVDHYLRVRAVDWVGNYSAWSPQPAGMLTQTSAKDGNAPAQVAGLSAAASRTLIGLSWTANSELDLAYYEIQRDDDTSGAPSGAWATIAVAHLNFYIDEDFTDGEISGEDTFWYRVRAVDTSTNEGAWAAQTSATLSRITADHIAANTITANQIAANTITAAEIAAGAVDTDELAADSVTAAKIDVATLSAITADMGTLTAGEIRVGAGTVGVDYTGFRIFASYIAGYNDDDLQVYIASADGKMYAGGGDLVLDEDGLTLTYPATGITPTADQLKWESAGTAYASLEINSGPAGGYSVLHLTAENAMIGNNITLEAADGVLVSHTMRIGTTTYDSGANTFQTIGLTLTQGAEDDEILACKSSDVAHGMTDETEADTYFTIAKVEATSGGADLKGYKDADGVAGYAINVVGNLGEAADNTKTTSGIAPVVVTAQVISGTTVGQVASNGNLFVVRNVGSTKFIVDAEGDILYDGGASSYDEEDDLALVREMVELAGMTEAERRAHTRQAEARKRSEALGIAHADDDGLMVSGKRHTALLRGALLQLDERLRRLEEAMTG